MDEVAALDVLLLELGQPLLGLEKPLQEPDLLAHLLLQLGHPHHLLQAKQRGEAMVKTLKG